MLIQYKSYEIKIIQVNYEACHKSLVLAVK